MYNIIFWFRYAPDSDSATVDCQQYGELDVFILGLQLEDLLPTFKRHHINFTALLTMTDEDLKQVCGTQCNK